MTASASFNQPQKNKVALIAGASRGLGRAMALRLAEEGAQTILLARTVGGLEELDDAIVAAGGLRPTLVPLDLTQEKDERGGDPLRSLARALADRHGRLDVLCVTAGVLPTMTLTPQIDAAAWHEAIALHLTCAYRLVANFAPLLARADAGRAVFFGDRLMLADSASPYFSAYVASKAGLAAFVRSWGAELRGSSLAANVVVPPPFRSALRTRGWPGENPENLPTPEEVATLCLPFLSAQETRSGAMILVPDIDKGC